MPKKRLYLSHVNNRYGENVYIPLSVGVLWAFARTFPEITNAYEFIDFLYLKEPIEQAVARLEDPDIIGIAHYIWNSEWNKAFAKAIKEKYPNCIVLVGGVHVPDESPAILDENSYFDFAIYGEGEGAFTDFLREHLIKNYANVDSLIWRDDESVRVNKRREFVDLDKLRSPYLDGVFDNLWEREPRWQVLQETARGCPYGCVFCEWGTTALSKLRPFSEERVFQEIEWFGQHKVPYVDNADANFGIIKRDVEITKHLVQVKEKYGFPVTFRTSFAKNSSDVIWNISNILHNANMLKAVTLALQSLQDDVLINIKRKNIKFDKFAEYIRRYDQAGIPTYTELIIGLAGETLDTFLNGIERCLEAGQHNGLFCYLNLALPNTEQNLLEYRSVHGIKTVSMFAMLSHGTPSETVREKQEIIVETASMPHEDWKRAYLHSKVVEIFHALGLLQDLALVLRQKGLRYRDFYSDLLDWCLANPTTIAGREVVAIRDLLNNALSGGLWDCVDIRFGSISWPPEEFAFIRICCELDRFYTEIKEFILSKEVSIDDFEKQRKSIVSPTPGDETKWAKETAWFGRKGYASKKRKFST